MNLPNAITAARIVVAPLIALLPLVGTPAARLAAFVLYVVAAITDYWDGYLARSRNLVTDLGRLLDPLADKLLLVATLVPMYLLQRGPLLEVGSATRFSELATFDPRFVTPGGLVGLPMWVLIVVIGREAFMTVFRQLAARRGVVISAIGPAKWKTGFQSVWVGSAYCWFWVATLAARERWSGAWMDAFALLNGVVGSLTMLGAVALTLYSLGLYLRRYGALFRRPAPVR
ncbi:MAG: CDP-alcohol phosphatidyltransferase family protein [Gemmatirosa sp.]|nr:CDP-alcohol phosphatidyltransferase family protein [Gemmatirosa sp.]